MVNGSCGAKKQWYKDALQMSLTVYTPKVQSRLKVDRLHSCSMLCRGLQHFQPEPDGNEDTSTTHGTIVSLAAVSL